MLHDLVGYHLRRASAVVGNDFSRAVAGTGMRQVLFGVLSIIAANPGINQGNVGRALGIQRANMVSLVNELVERDLVLREVAPEDRRAFRIALTPKGRSELTRAKAAAAEVNAALTEGFTSAEIDIVARWLTSIQTRFPRGADE